MAVSPHSITATPAVPSNRNTGNDSNNNEPNSTRRTPAKSTTRKRPAFFPDIEVNDDASMLLNLSSPRNTDLTNAPTPGAFSFPLLANELLRKSATPREDCEAATALIALNSPTTQHASSFFGSNGDVLENGGTAWEEVILQNPPSLGKLRKIAVAAATKGNDPASKKARSAEDLKSSCVTPLPNHETTVAQDLNAELTDLSSNSLSPVAVVFPRPNRTGGGLSVLNEVLFPANPPTSSDPVQDGGHQDADTERESPYSVISASSQMPAAAADRPQHPLLAAKKLRKLSAPPAVP